MLAAIVLGLTAIHIAYSAYVNTQYAGHDTPATSRRAHLIIQAPLLWLSVYLAVQAGIFSRDLFSPVYIGVGLIAGHFIFGISLLATHQSPRDAWTHVYDFGPLWDFTVNSPIVLSRFLGVAIAEELIWRVAVQTMLIESLSRFMQPQISVVAGILVTAAGFAIVHKHFFENTWPVTLEFCAFSILLGVLYYWSDSFIFVMVIHAMRDIEIAYLEYLIKVDELGDEETAAKHIEQSYMPVRPGRA